MQLVSTTKVLAYANEVRASGTSYIWRTGDVDRGTVSDLFTAINNTIWQSTGTGREVHILAGGNLSATIGLPPDVSVYFHNNTYTTTHTGIAVHARNVANVRVYDMRLNASSNFYVFRFSGCNNAVLSGININGGGIGMRLESSNASDPWNFTFYDLTVTNCLLENLGSHGIETYSVDRFNITGIVARNTGEAGLLLNNSRNGTIGTVDAYKCNYLGGYAGLRFANTCNNITTQSVISRECGRGLFMTSGTNNVHVMNATIIDCVDQWGMGRGIWLENTPDCSVRAGCSNSGISVSGANSYATVSTTCGSAATTTYYKIQNRSTGLVLDGMGRTVNGSVVGQWSSATTHFNAQWQRIDYGTYVQFKNRGTRMVIDGENLTANGSILGQRGIHAGNSQQWSILPTDGGYFRLQNRGTGMFIDGYGRTANGSDAAQYANTTNPNAQWRLVSVGSGPVAAKEDNLTLSLGESLENKEAASILIYPNPATDQFTIKLPSGDDTKKVARLYDGIGKIVASATFTGGEHIISIGHLSPGTYILRVEGSQKPIVQKVIKL